MRFFLTLANVIAITIALSIPTLANTVEPPSTPEIIPPTSVCADGSPVWGDGKAQFDTLAQTAGGQYLGTWTSPDDNSFAVFYDFRGAPDVDPRTPIFAIVFDANGCFQLSTFLDEQTVQDAFGIVLVKK